MSALSATRLGRGMRFALNPFGSASFMLGCWMLIFALSQMGVTDPFLRSSIPEGGIPPMKEEFTMYSRILLAILALSCLSIGMVNAQEFVTDGLVAMWTFEGDTIHGETVTDVSGNGNDAKMMGTLNPVDGPAPGLGQAFQYDGGQNYVEIPKLGAWEQVSIECWAMEEQFGGIQGIVSTWQWAAGKVHFKFESNQIQVHKNDGVKIRLAQVDPEVWYHIIYTTDTAADELKLYVNGELVDEGTSGGAPENMDERRIGSEHDGRFLIGKIDEVRLYNRVLDAGEVAQNFGIKSNTWSVSPSDKLAVSWGTIKTLR